MKRKIQRDYDDLLPEGWRPDLSNRKQLLTWACNQQSSYLADNSGAPVDNCANYAQLLEKYGPNYDSLRAKLGNVRGLWTDNDSRHYN